MLHNFASPPQGAYPANGVIRDEQGNLYGTTNGAYSDVPGGDKQRGRGDGTPYAGVVLRPNGNLYGTTIGGGQTNAGVVFESPSTRMIKLAQRIELSFWGC